MLPAAVVDYLDSHKQQNLDALVELLRFASIANVSGPDDECDKAARWLNQRLEGMGLQSEVLATEGKPVVLAEAKVAPSAPTLLIYGHYDVQPADPLDLWDSPPFEPVVRDGKIFARGANDDKGQLFTHLMAVDAYMRTGGLPINIKIILEGEEEIGSPHMEAFIDAHRDRLACDAVVISDSEFFARNVPSITYGLRGMGGAEVVFRGPEMDLHSGLYGGVVQNPIHALAQLIAGLHDADGSITIDGFYDGVMEVTDDERRLWKKLPIDEHQVAESVGVDQLTAGEKGIEMLERQWARPTLDCNGIIGGFTGEGRKTVLPAEARAKLSFRIAPGQDPSKLAAAFERHVKQHTPAGIRSEVWATGDAKAVLLPIDSPFVQAAAGALKDAFGHDVAFIRCGATVPITEMFQRLLGVEPVMMGFGLPDDRIHSPNEKFDLCQLYNGALASAAFISGLSSLRQL
jgi:succinyl-diaminopimelate desuccinylase